MSELEDASTTELAQPKDPYKEWVDRWLAEDFSWDALAHKRRWLKQEGIDQQAAIRKIEGNQQDSNLVRSGKLIPVPGRGLYHVAFIPQIWTTHETFPLTGEELRDRQTQFWSRVVGSEFRDTYSGVIEGIHFPAGIDSQVCSGTRASFNWCSIESVNLSLPSRGGRKFDNCIFHSGLKLSGNYTSSDPKPWLRISNSILLDRLDVEKLKAVSRIELDGCQARGINFQHSDIGSLTIDDCDFTRISSWNTEFTAKVVIRNCAFHAGVELLSSRFKDDFEIIDSEIDELLDLMRCDFEQRVTFADVTWPPAGYLVASLSGSRFRGLLTFASAAPPPIQIFREAGCEGGLALGRYTTAQWRDMLAEELDAWQFPRPEIADKLAHSQNIENAARNLRRNAERESDVHAEHFWHRAELIARRSRDDVSVLEKAFSHLYGLVADYGLSMSRPFAAIVVLTVVCSLLYWAVGSSALWGGPADWHSLEESLGFSLSRMLPIGAFGSDENTWRQTLLGHGGTIGSIAVRTVATAQTIMSAILIFLGVMAIRRKFKIN